MSQKSSLPRQANSVSQALTPDSMSLPQRTDLTNDNGKPEDHLAAATAALYASLKDLDASIEVLASKIKPLVEGASQRWPTR
jgi:hypothetical protein